ncbi:MAG: amidohydrolase, partial [Beijerinckiaceae bacterium]|nr:amidohydrolase [Beijerinckiaceae bacterium]
CHGGGYFPYNLGRINRNYREKLGQASALPRTPTEFLKALWYDSCVYDEDVLQRLVEIVGDDKIIMGSDYPVGNPDPVGFIKSCKFAPDTERKILRGNAVQLFKL